MVNVEIIILFMVLGWLIESFESEEQRLLRKIRRAKRVQWETEHPNWVDVIGG